VQELAGFLSLVPFNPGVLAVVEACQGSCNHLKGLGLLAHTHDLAGLDAVGGDIHHLAIDDDVAVADELTGSSTGGSNAETEDDIVQAALQILEQDFTGNTIGAGCLLKHVAELLLEYAIGVFGLLLLSKHDAVLGGLATTVVAMLPGREVTLGQNLVGTENGLAETAGNL